MFVASNLEQNLRKQKCFCSPRVSGDPGGVGNPGTFTSSPPSSFAGRELLIVKNYLQTYKDKIFKVPELRTSLFGPRYYEIGWKSMQSCYFFKADLMVIVPRTGDPLNDEIHEKWMFSRVFPYLDKNPGLGKQVDQASVNRYTRPG